MDKYLKKYLCLLVNNNINDTTIYPHYNRYYDYKSILIKTYDLLNELIVNNYLFNHFIQYDDTINFRIGLFAKDANFTSFDMKFHMRYIYKYGKKYFYAIYIYNDNNYMIEIDNNKSPTIREINRNDIIEYFKTN